MKNKIALVLCWMLVFGMQGVNAQEKIETKQVKQSVSAKAYGDGEISIREVVPSVNTLLRSVRAYTMYIINYNFSRYLVSQPRHFAWKDICLFTNPILPETWNQNDFTVELQKRRFGNFYDSKGTRSLTTNRGYQTLRWNNVGSGDFRLIFSDNDYGGWIDLEATFDNCR